MASSLYAFIVVTNITTLPVRWDLYHALYYHKVNTDFIMTNVLFGYYDKAIVVSHIENNIPEDGGLGYPRGPLPTTGFLLLAYTFY